MAQALVEAADAAGRADRLARRDRGRLARATPTRRPATSPRPATCPGGSGSFPLGATLSEALGAPVRIANDVDVATNAEFKLGAGKPYESLLGVFWGTGVGGGVILDGKRWTRPRRRRRDRPHGGQARRRAAARAGGAAAWRPTPGAARWRRRRGASTHDGAKTKLFEIMEERDRDRLTSGIWERALEHDDPLAEKLIERALKALGAGVASAVNLLDVEAVIIGGGLGVRFGEPYVEKIAKQMHPHLFVDDRPPAMHVAALGDLGGAIGASLLFDEYTAHARGGYSGSQGPGCASRRGR